jgi:hypothetical protein
MKKILALALTVFFFNLTFADGGNKKDDEPIGKGSYNLLKFDALNLMGLGVQKLHLSYEISPMKQNENNLPTLQFNLTAPFNSLNECADINYGIEGGAELRFYQKNKRRTKLAAEGFFIGVGLDGGYVNFNRTEKYFSSIGFGNKEVDTEYNRIRTGIYFLSGAQTKLGEKLYFDVNVGMGWSNVSVETNEPTSKDSDWRLDQRFCGLFYILYEEGKYQQFYMPVSFSIGYNFGSK